MSKAYFAPLVTKPIIITGPGYYLTRNNQTVAVEIASIRHDFGCRGTYPNGAPERWHRSGRLFAGAESANDIVRAA